MDNNLFTKLMRTNNSGVSSSKYIIIGNVPINGQYKNVSVVTLNITEDRKIDYNILPTLQYDSYLKNSSLKYEYVDVYNIEFSKIIIDLNKLIPYTYTIAITPFRLDTVIIDSKQNISYIETSTTVNVGDYIFCGSRNELYNTSVNKIVETYNIINNFLIPKKVTKYIAKIPDRLFGRNKNFMAWNYNNNNSIVFKGDYVQKNSDGTYYPISNKLLQLYEKINKNVPWRGGTPPKKNKK